MNDEIESGEAPTSANHGIFSYKGEISRGKFVFFVDFPFSGEWLYCIYR